MNARNVAGTQASRWRMATGLMVIAIFLAISLILWRSGVLERLLNGATLERMVLRLGLMGPALIMGLMTIAIVMSPIPSAPIALAAGAAYGHYWGTVYVALGAEIGALVAFAIARLVGYEALQAQLGGRLSNGLPGRFLNSQNALTVAVFATRLMPFLSFDIVSYAAGLTTLRAWRFAVATLLGIMPASFVLAHFGGLLASGDLHGAALTVLALGAITLLPVAWKALPRRCKTAVARMLRLG
ncbi:MAG TPA: VTT domain-containing protein [Gammaproteobacteria bacterium]|nr:VTT domain-containing protein [Gammaproteobacteria bacterium]